MSERTVGWRTVLLAGLAVLAVLGIAEVLLQTRVRPVHRREVADAERDFETGDPTVLVLGSSHARTFAAMSPVLRERSGGREEMIAVPLEAGRYTSYRWVLEHRITPYVDEMVDGHRKRTRLKRMILLSNWWDGVHRDFDLPGYNLPSHAWHLGDFVEDVAANGITPHNRNYLQSKLQDIGWDSLLVNMRGPYRPTINYGDYLHPPTDEQLARRQAQWAKHMRGVLRSCIAFQENPVEMKAMEDILDWAERRNIETTMVLFPIPPVQYDEDLRKNLIEPSHRAICAVAQRRGIRCIDGSLHHPMVDSDFMADLDHMNRVGDARYADWVLGGDLSFLLQPAAEGRGAVAPSGASR